MGSAQTLDHVDMDMRRSRSAHRDVGAAGGFCPEPEAAPAAAATLAPKAARSQPPVFELRPPDMDMPAVTSPRDTDRRFAIDSP